MDSPLDPSKFNLHTPEGKTELFMTAQAELFGCISNLEKAMEDISTIIHSIDLELSSTDKLISVDNILHKYILSWQTMHLYYQELLKMKNVVSPKYYQDDLYTK
jgi:hypothetical protein